LVEPVVRNAGRVIVHPQRAAQVLPPSQETYPRIQARRLAR
jgi:hypothetical protein